MSQGGTWYKSWFDTEYYHLLYKHRNDHEAKRFIQNLLDYLGPDDHAEVLDLACGRGRHARILGERDLKVTGLDLSKNNIGFARRFEDQNLRFLLGDMREDLGKDRYDYVFNLFTSFGYFGSLEESKQALRNIHTCLRIGGILVLDFLNVKALNRELPAEEVVQESGVEFRITRQIREGYVVKDIKVLDGSKEFHFEERVQLLSKSLFVNMFDETGFSLRASFGDFDLSTFDPNLSNRLIMIADRK